MNRVPRSALLVRLVVATVLAGAIAAAVGAAVQWTTARDALRTEIAERNAALAVELAARLDNRISNEVSILALIANRQRVAQLGSGAQAELRAVLGAAAAFDELVLYDAEGRPVAAAASRFVTSAADEPARPELAGAVGSGPVVELLEGLPPVLEVAVPVEEPPGTAAGVLLARVPLEVVAAPALQVDNVLATTRYMITMGGRVIVHPERDLVLEGERVPVDRLLDEQRDATRFDVGGDTHLVAAAPMQALDAAVVIDQLESVALAPIGDQLRELTLILALVMVATVVAVSAAGTWLLAPLAPLAQAVRRLGRKERGVRVDERSTGEVAALASEFNRLAEALDQRDEELDELQRLSLMLNTRTSRHAVAAELVSGAARLLRIDEAGYCSVGDGPPEVVAVHGAIAEGAVLEHAAAAMRIARPHLGSDGEQSYAALPIAAVDGRNLGALVVARAEPFEPDELVLAETYTAFAGAALENVERLALEQGLAAELAEAVEQRRSLMSTVSHEFRTPLTCIDGFSTALMEQWDAYDEATRRELVAKVRHHSRELEDLVGRLLDFAVTERGTLEASVVPVSLGEIVDGVVAATEPLLDGRAVRVEVPDLTVEADPVLLRRAVSNLLSNAVKYSAAGTPVEVRAVDDGRRVRLEVVDEGVGLAAEDAARAFQPFWRAGNASTRSNRGAGLGLALVAEYARAMGGGAGVVSEPGHGSTFFVTLQASAPGDGSRSVE